MSLNATLLAAYQSTIYRVSSSAEISIDLHIGQACPNMDSWLQEQGFDLAHLITAYNPFSEKWCDEQNLAAHAALKARLEKLDCRMLACTHIDPDGQWPEEHGFAIAGLSREQAVNLASHYQQNAIVEYRCGQAARLVVCQR